MDNSTDTMCSIDWNLLGTWIGAFGSVASGICAVIAMVLAFKAYDYATKQYINQKKIDRGIDIAYEIYSQLDSMFLNLKEDFEMYDLYVTDINNNRNKLSMSNPDVNIEMHGDLVMLNDYIPKILDKISDIEENIKFWIFKLNLVADILTMKNVTDHTDRIKLHFNGTAKNNFRALLSDFEANLMAVEDTITGLSELNKAEIMALTDCHIPKLVNVPKPLHDLTIDLVGDLNHLVILVFKP